MWELLKQGGVVMYPLGLCSLLTVAIFIERAWHFARANRDPRDVLSRAERALAAGGNPKPRWRDAPAPAERVAGGAASPVAASSTIAAAGSAVLASGSISPLYIQTLTPMRPMVVWASVKP